MENDGKDGGDGGRRTDESYSNSYSNYAAEPRRRTYGEYPREYDNEKSYIKLFNGKFWKTIFASLITVAIGMVGWAVAELVNLRQELSTLGVRLENVQETCDDDAAESFRRIERLEDLLFGNSGGP